MSLNTFGLKPHKHWKLFEHEGFQVIAYVGPHDDDEDKYDLVLEGYVDELGATTTLRIGTGVEATAIKLWEAIGEEGGAEKVVQGWLDQIGPAVAMMLGGPKPEGYEVDRVKFEDGTVLRANGTGLSEYTDED